MTANINLFHHKIALADQLARQVCRHLEYAVAERGSATLVVSGGSTPVPFFQRLSEQVLPWSKITILLADERWVSRSDDASNEKLVREYLLQNLAAAAKFVSLRTDQESTTQAVSQINERLSTMPQFDVVVLGMGDDGHTASIFPCSEELESALTTTDPVLCVSPKTAPHTRISMSKYRLLNARHIFVHLVGQSKKVVLDKALEPTSKLPMSAILQQKQVPVDVMLALPKE